MFSIRTLVLLSSPIGSVTDRKAMPIFARIAFNAEKSATLRENLSTL
ncbi:hypothetical protein IKG29_03330 [Candidatus Saccharibacteria bacterium]|nr:hypothetical protein [Candidatus Saccharibacteria bacterium]MBR3329525.1 hypothetical protein [Candidatus Saccharibacteria bacterium]